MKYFIVLLVFLPFCLTIEVDLFQIYGTAIKKVEIPSCDATPCPLVKGTPLNISITVESVYPPETEFTTVTDFKTSIGINGYRNRYVYELVEDPYVNRFCKIQPDECPLSMNKLYTIKKELFLSADDPAEKYWPFGSRNGKTYVDISVVMYAHDDVGTLIGKVDIALDIKAAQN